MKSKVNMPFIYFLMEPKIVFVYKIDTQKYLNISDLSEGEWAAFALNHGDEWAMFHHEKSEPLEGQSYWFAQQDLVKIVEEINTQIQHYRHSTYHEAADARMHAVHIVSSESAAGSIRVALEPPKQVIGFPDAFSIGPLWKLEEKVGQTYRHEWLYENINYELDDADYQHKFTNTLREIEDIPHQVPVYIWYGDNADEQIGLRFFLYYLRDKTNEIILINTTACNATNGTLDNQHLSHTSQMDSTYLRRLFEKSTENKPLTDIERLVLQRDWETLSQKKDVLRLWMNEKITSVPENHFDPVILSTVEKLHSEQVSKDFIQTSEVIGELLTQMNGVANVFFLEYRIRHLVYSGVLALKGIPKSMRRYQIQLRV